MDSKALIRDANLGDAERLLEIYSYYVKNTAISFEYDVPSLNEFRSRMKNRMEKYPYLVIENEDGIHGYAYAGSFVGRTAYDRSCELTIYLDHTAQKCGFGKILYAAMESALKQMGILNMYAYIAYLETEDEYLTTNSADFHAHLGFTKVGHFHQCGYK